VDSFAIPDVQIKASSYGLNLNNITLDASCSLANKLLTYPNPASDIIHLFTGSEIQKVQVFDMAGHKAVELETIDNELDISNSKTGALCTESLYQ